MKLSVTLALLGLTSAIENTADESTTPRSVWVSTAPMYKDVYDKYCKGNDDCSPGYVCADHMWAYNGQ
jgi:hypothetical protein